MSDNHARLFTSAVPGNGSSDTVGENGNGHEGETDITQETWDIGRYTPDQSDNRQRGTSPLGETGDVDDGEPNEIELECIERMDDLVKNFRCNEITKLKVLSCIISILDLNPSRSEWVKDAAVEYYAKTLDEVQALSSSAVRRGTIVENAFDSGRQSPNPTESRRPTNQDAEIDELISQISRDSERPRGQSSGTESDNELDLDRNGASNKKRRVFESQMPWYTKEEEARRSGNKDCEESRRILQLFAWDYKVCTMFRLLKRTLDAYLQPLWCRLQHCWVYLQPHSIRFIFGFWNIQRPAKQTPPKTLTDEDAEIPWDRRECGRTRQKEWKG